MTIAKDLMDFIPGTELKKGETALLNKHTGLTWHPDN